MQKLPIKRAILSVTDKSGLPRLASFLSANGVEIVSTGGTQKALEAAGLPVVPVSAVTGFPEILGGRVKTLHPHVHGAILADKDNAQHMETLASLDLPPFDLVCVNLYNFADAIRQQKSISETIEQIDIGGPCLLRAAAKNFQSILVLPDPKWYEAAIVDMQRNDMHSGLHFRRQMAYEAFSRTADYDAMIADYFRAAASN